MGNFQIQTQDISTPQLHDAERKEKTKAKKVTPVIVYLSESVSSIHSSNE